MRSGLQAQGRAAAVAGIWVGDGRCALTNLWVA
jgi:hypothetical protein